MASQLLSQGSPVKMRELRLPVTRVKTIMKSSPYIDSIGQDGLFLVAKATELFIHHLTEEAHSQSNKGNSLEYKHLAEVVQTNDTLEFLREIMPRKITVRQFKEMMAAKNSPASSCTSSSSESSSDSDSDSQSDSSSSRDSDGKKLENGDSSNSDSESENKENDKSEVSCKSNSEEENKA